MLSSQQVSSEQYLTSAVKTKTVHKDLNGLHLQSVFENESADLIKSNSLFMKKLLKDL